MITETATNISTAFMQLVVLFSNCSIRQKQGIPTGRCSLNTEKFQVIFTDVSNTHTQKD